MKKPHAVFHFQGIFFIVYASGTLIGLNFRADPVWKSRMRCGILGDVFRSFSLLSVIALRLS